MRTVAVVFPHQLFERSPLVRNGAEIYLVEEPLFFRQYRFHKRKLAFHRAGMKFYESRLRTQGVAARYIEAFDELADIRGLIPHLKRKGIERLEFVDPTDNWLEARIEKACREQGLAVTRHESPLFLNSRAEARAALSGGKRVSQTSFYIRQRKDRGILLDDHGKPRGGRWTFDPENRRPYPKDKIPPALRFAPANRFHREAREYVERQFPGNYGELEASWPYPCTYAGSRKWFDAFLRERFREFGDYEDAIVAGEPLLHHSLLSPLLNVGLLGPREVLDGALAHAKGDRIPLNSTEGFVRQILGWREFLRGLYETKGSEQRTRNFWGFTRRMPRSFWDGRTGVPPVDATIRKVLKTGYCHHIERLMVLGNFMLLCELRPDDVYRWFMEMFVDAYDWVMVPNVYGMSQFADGGLVASKPYISGSRYVTRMSDHPPGEWQALWDALFWRFVSVRRDFFLSNPRLGVLARSFEKMAAGKRRAHLMRAEAYLGTLEKG